MSASQSSASAVLMSVMTGGIKNLGTSSKTRLISSVPTIRRAGSADGSGGWREGAEANMEGGGREGGRVGVREGGMEERDGGEGWKRGREGREGRREGGNGGRTGGKEGGKEGRREGGRDLEFPCLSKVLVQACRHAGGESDKWLETSLW